MNFIDHACALLKGFDIEPKPLDRMLAAYLLRHREINAVTRRLLSDLIFGVMRWRRRLDGWLLMSGRRRPDWKGRALCYLAWKTPDLAVPAGLSELISELKVNHFEMKMPENFPGGEAAFCSFPDFLYEKFVDAFGAAGAGRIVERLNDPSYPVLRVNTSLSTRDEVIRRLENEEIGAAATTVSPFGIRLSGRVNIAGTAVYREGLVEMQDEASQLSTVLADPGPDGAVLDVCAGAGGKTLMLAMLMGDRGRVVATDIDRLKLREMRRRIKKARTSCIEVISIEDLERRKNASGCFDVVLIDAPCSGTGTLRRNPDLRWRLSLEKITERVRMQRDILKQYGRYVRPGGRLVYVTCSLLPEENENVVEEFLETADFHVVDASERLLRLGISPQGLVGKDGFFRSDLEKGDWDGFFAACMEKG